MLSDWYSGKITLGIFQVFLSKHFPSAAKRAVKWPVVSLSQASLEGFIDAIMFSQLPREDEARPHWLTDWVPRLKLLPRAPCWGALDVHCVCSYRDTFKEQ